MSCITALTWRWCSGSSLRLKLRCEKRPIYVKRYYYTWKETYTRDLCTIKRDRRTWRWVNIRKETYMYEKRPIYVTRVVYMWKETFLCEKRPMYVKKDLCMWTETYICKRPVYVKRDLCMWKETFMCEKRPMYVRDLYMWKETHKREWCSGSSPRLKASCECMKRDLFTLKRDIQKRPWTLKRDLQKRPVDNQKRPTKETYRFSSCRCTTSNAAAARCARSWGVNIWKETYKREKRPVYTKDP